MHDYNFDTILSTDEKFLYIKLTKLGQTLHVDKTGFLRLSQIYSHYLQYYNYVHVEALQK